MKKYGLILCLCTALFAQSESVEPEAFRVAVLPFENRTPNPNIDWISNLFVDSYRTALTRRFRYADVSDEATARALELIAEYRLSGKVRYQVFAALTGADIVLGGSFSPSGSDAIIIESQLFASRTNNLELLDKQSTPIDSGSLLPAVDRAAAAAVSLVRPSAQANAEKPPLVLPYQPRLVFYCDLPAGQKENRLPLEERLVQVLADRKTREFQYRQVQAPEDSAASEALLVAQLMESDHAAYAAVARSRPSGRGYTATLNLYSPQKQGILATFTGTARGRHAAIEAAAQQLAAFIATWQFKPRLQVEGLKGKDLALQFNGLFEQQVSNNGAIEFGGQTTTAAKYEFKITREPEKPSQRCFLLGATGNVTITGINHATVVCITKRYAVEGTVEGLTGGEVVIKLAEGEPVPLRQNSAFRFPDTLEDFEPVHLTVLKTPEAPPQQCDFVSPPERVTGKTAKLRLYCMPLTQHWLTFSVAYPLMQGNPARSVNLVPNGSFPLNALSGRFGVTAGYWTRYLLRYGFLVGGELSYVYMQGTTDLYTSTGFLVESNETLYYHSFGLNAMLGYALHPRGNFFSNTEIIPFVGIGTRYTSLRTASSVALLGVIGPGAIAGFNWYYKYDENIQLGLRYHADLVYIAGEPIILQHVVGLQMGLRL